ncbi:MAG TPA: DUF5665 domain-containing protein [Candidatus Saccharimonadales bacterium]
MSAIKKATKRIKEDNERGARENVLEELFNDFNRSKTQIFIVNFFRGIFFGIGSVIGGALIIAIGALVLGLFVDLPGGVGDFVQQVLDAMQRR